MIHKSSRNARRFLGLTALLAVFAMPGCIAQDAPAAECDGPMNVSATAMVEGNLVTWDEWSFARAYEVWRATGDGSFEQVGVTQGDHPETPGGGHDTDFLDEDVVPGTTYTYQIRALGPPPHVSDVCDEATVTAIPVFPAFAAMALASCAAVGAYVFGRRST